jgi:spore germination cell wall hydrolase CwlJ-like protein
MEIDPRAKDEQQCLIDAVIYEAADQEYKGMALSLETILYRTEDGFRTDGTFCGTVNRPGQYSFTAKDPALRRTYTPSELIAAQRVVFTYLYGNPTRMLPEGCYSYINADTATDLSWYSEDLVTMAWMNHEFLCSVR